MYKEVAVTCGEGEEKESGLAAGRNAFPGKRVSLRKAGLVSSSSLSRMKGGKNENRERVSNKGHFKWE